MTAVATSTTAIRFTLGRRTLLTIPRRVHRVGLSLDEALGGIWPALPPLGRGDAGWLITSLPDDQWSVLAATQSGMIASVRQRYPRRFADLTGGFDAYLAGMSGNARSSLKRKTKRLAELAAGELDVRCYRSPDELREFHRLARGVSAMTYQERLLDAGLPGHAAFLDSLDRLGTADQARGWLLFVDSKPVAYLYLPAAGDTLIYAHLGFDPALADHSPGAVLQLEAMRQLFAERRFARVDFTEGDGQHKRQFATGSIACVDLLLLRSTSLNRTIVGALRRFDSAVERLKASSLGSHLRRFTR